MTISLPVISQAISVETDASAVFPTTFSGTIVRNYNDLYAVGYLRDSVDGYFYSSAIEAFSIPSTLPFTLGTRMKLFNQWTIQDIQVHRNYIYFCGTDGSNHGLYGRFHINDLLSPGIHNFIAYRFVDVKCLNKIVVVDTNSKTNLIAIGEGYNYAGVDHDVIIEVKDYNNYPTIPLIALMSAADLSHREILQDVLVVGGKAIFVGMDTRTPFKTFFVRRSNKYNVVLDNELHNTYHYTPALSVGSVITSLSTCSAVMEDKYVSIAHMCDNPPNGFNMLVNTIDALGYLNSISVHMISHVNRAELVEMKYLPLVKNLVLLSYNGMYQTDFLIWNPGNTTTYTTTSSYENNIMYSSIDVLNNQSYISASKSHWFLQRTYPSITPSYCKPSQNMQVQIVTPHEQSVIQEKPYIETLTTTPIYVDVITTNIPLSINCQY